MGKIREAWEGIRVHGRGLGSMGKIEKHGRGLRSMGKRREA